MKFLKSIDEKINRKIIKSAPAEFKYYYHLIRVGPQQRLRKHLLLRIAQSSPLLFWGLHQNLLKVIPGVY